MGEREKEREREREREREKERKMYFKELLRKYGRYGRRNEHEKATKRRHNIQHDDT